MGRLTLLLVMLGLAACGGKAASWGVHDAEGYLERADGSKDVGCRFALDGNDSVFLCVDHDQGLRYVVWHKGSVTHRAAVR